MEIPTVSLHGHQSQAVISYGLQVLIPALLLKNLSGTFYFLLTLAWYQIYIPRHLLKIYDSISPS